MTPRAQPAVHHFIWMSPSGEITLRITHTKTFFGRANIITIEAPPGIHLPLDTLSCIVTDTDLAEAGDAKAYVARLLTQASRATTAGEPAPAQGDLFHSATKAPTQPGRRPATRSAPKP